MKINALNKIKNALFCLAEHPSHAPVGYGEIPKSCTIENRQNLIEHQLYATIQRKQPPVPPFTSDTATVARKGFDTIMSDRLKRLNNGEMDPNVTACPFGPVVAKNSFMPTAAVASAAAAAANSRCATLGRMKNLEMTEYHHQRHNYLNGGTVGANIVSFEITAPSSFRILNYFLLRTRL